jgi:hypothetical protein
MLMEKPDLDQRRGGDTAGDAKWRPKAGSKSGRRRPVCFLEAY